MSEPGIVAVELFTQSKRAEDPEPDRDAMAYAEIRGALDCMAEGVAEVEQQPLRLVEFVTLNEPLLGLQALLNDPPETVEFHVDAGFLGKVIGERETAPREADLR